MNHIDEGTIHAWIDGAVDAAQSREIESHVAECSVCAEAVAEARGLVAGASRILLALDDVPAGVTPKRAPVHKRQWRAAPWVTGIAAALVLAIGVTTWNREAVKSEMRQTVLVPETTETTASRPVANEAAPTPTTTQSAPLTKVVQGAAPAAPSESDVPKAARTGGQRRALSDVAQRAKDEREPARRDAAVERGMVAGGISGAAAGRAMASSAPAPKLDAIVATGAAEGRVRAALTSVEQRAGCYSVQLASQQKEKGFVPAASDAAKRTARAPAAAPAPASSRAEFSQNAAPLAMMIRLDTARTRSGFAVLAATSDSLIGFWSEIGTDSASVDLLARGEYVVTAKNRVECPK
jgi:hypothetical protein